MQKPNDEIKEDVVGTPFPAFLRSLNRREVEDGVKEEGWSQVTAPMGQLRSQARRVRGGGRREREKDKAI